MLRASPLNYGTDGLRHKSLAACRGREPVADGSALVQPNRDRTDEDVVVTADRKCSLVRFVPRPLGGVQERAPFPIAVGDRDIRNEPGDFRVLAGSDDRAEVVCARFPKNEPLCPHLHVRSIARMRQSSGMTPESAVHDETANKSDDSASDGVQADHAGQQEREHHQRCAALPVAVSASDHNPGNAD